MSRKVEDVNCLSSFYYSQSLPIQFLPNNPVGLSSLQTPERWISSFRALINLGLFLPGASCWHKAEVCQQDIKSNDRFLIKVFLALKKRHLRNRPFLPEMLICKNATMELQQPSCDRKQSLPTCCERQRDDENSAWSWRCCGAHALTLTHSHDREHEPTRISHSQRDFLLPDGDLQN